MSMTEHLHDIPTSVGIMTVIATSRRSGRPLGLKKPYEYVLPFAQTRAIVKDLATGLEARGGEDLFQCVLVEWKPLKNGIRLHLWVLGFRPGLCGPSEHAGVSRENWDNTCKFLQDTLFRYLGEDARMYSEPYSEDRKFQLRFDTYVMYSDA